MSIHAPAILEATHKGERLWDLQSYLLQSRIILLTTAIDRNVAANITSQILVLHNQDSNKPIKMFINSPGGEVVAGFAIYDFMKWTSCPVETICIGEACSAASILLAAGEKGHRAIFQRSRILLHQPWGGTKGQVTDIKIQYEEMQYMKDESIRMLAHDTGQSTTTLAIDLERDKILRAQEAINYGLVDKILQGPNPLASLPS